MLNYIEDTIQFINREIIEIDIKINELDIITPITITELLKEQIDIIKDLQKII